MPPKSRAKAKGAGKKVAVPKNQADLEECLSAFLSGDNEKIAKATEMLKSFLNIPSSIPALFHRVSIDTGRPDTRQLACVLISKKISRYWAGLQQTHMLNPAQSDAVTCREYILTILHSGTAPRLLIHNLSYLTSIIARLDFRRKRWPGLIDWLLGALQSNNINHVDASLRILYSVLESQVSSSLSAHFGEYYPLFCRWIGEAPEPAIRHRAILALHSLLGAIEDDEQQDACIQNTLPSLIPALTSCHKNLEYDSVKAIITILSSSMENTAFDGIIVPAIQAIGPIIVDTEIDIPVRAQAASFLTDYIATYPIRITSPVTLPDGSTIRFLDSILHVAFNLLLEEDDDPFINQEDNAQKIALTLFEELFKYVPREEVFPHCLQKFQECLHHANPFYRKAAYVLVMTCAEHVPYLTYDGTPIPYKGISKPLLNVALLAGTDQLPVDPSDLVKEAICLAFTWLCEEFSSLIEQRDLHVEPLRQILNVLPTVPPSELRKRLFMSLDAFIECIGPKVLPTLPEIMAQLAIQLNQPQIEQQEAAIDTIASIALSVGEHFRPYFAPVLPLMSNILSAPRNEQVANIQDKTLRALSACARAVGIQNWSPEIKTILITTTKNCLNVTVDQRHEQEFSIINSSLTFLGNVMATLAEVLDEANPDAEILEMLTKTYDASIYAIQSLDGIHFKDNNIDAPNLGTAFDDVSSDSENEEHALSPTAALEAEEDEEDLFNDDKGYYFDTESLEMKSSAMSTLVLLMHSLGRKIYLLKPCQLYEDNYELDVEDQVPGVTPSVHPQLVQVTQDPLLRIQHVMLDAAAYLSDHFLTQAITVLTTSVELVSLLAPMQRDVGVRVPFSEQARPLIIQPIALFLECIVSNQDSAVVAHVLNQFITLLDLFGPSLIYESITQQFYDTLEEILKENITCLTGAEMKDIRSGQGEEAIESAFELIGQLARWFGPVFLVEFLNTPEKLQMLINFCSPDRPDSFRGNAVGCLAEILEFTGAQSSQLIPFIFPLVDNLLHDKSAAVRHNTMFLAGECAQLTNAELVPQLEMLPRVFQRIVQHILPPAQYNDPNTSNDEQCCHDNAVSAAIRFVLAFPQLFGYENIPNLMATFPLKGDDQEIVKIMMLVPRLLQNAFDVMKPFIPVIIVQIGQILSRGLYELREGSRSIFVQLTKSLFAQCPAEAQQAIGLLAQDVDSQKALQECLQ